MTADATPQENLKSIFVISPIAKEDADGFDFTELFLNEIVKPAAEDAGGFKVPVRADEVRKPGSITSMVVREIVNADVCIADLTGRNPNVMYEVAIAHAADKPVILLQQEAGGPPFDFTDERVIRYSTRADGANRARKVLTDHLKNARHEDGDKQLEMTMHPVRVVFRDLQTRASASEPEQAILERLDNFEGMLKKALHAAQSSRLDGPEGRSHTLKPRSDEAWSRTNLLNQVQALAVVLLDESTYEHLRSHLESGEPDMGTLFQLHGVLQRAAEEKKAWPGSESRALLEAVEFVTSLPPF